MIAPFVSLRIDVKGDDSPRCGEWISIRAELASDSPGLHHVWFVLMRGELEAIVRGERTTAEDGYHRLHVAGDDWTFYDHEMPRERSGVMRCPFVRLTFPRTFMRAVLRLARKTWRLMAQARAAGADRYDRVSEVSIAISADHYARINRLYGFGKGAARIDMCDETRAFLDASIEASRDSDQPLGTMLDRVCCIARNTTRGFHQCARVQLSKDWDGFFWRAQTSSGQTVMHGGIVNHGRDGTPSWSIHT